MTTFVPLAADTDGTASAVAVGEWLLHLITLYDSEDTQRTKDYYREFMSCFTRDEAAGETKITNPINLLSLLLSQNELVFRWLGEIRSAQDAQGQPPAAAETRPELKKSYGDALREVQDFFMLLMSLVVLRITDVEAAGQMAGNFCAVFRASKDQPEFRLKLLMGLYNVFPPSFPYRFPIFVAILEYATETNLFHLLLPYVKYINEWAKDWNLGPAAKRQVYLMLANGLKKLGKTEEAYDYLKRHVQFFQGETEEVLNDPATVAAAVELATDSVKMGDILYFDSLLSYSAIQNLNKTEHSFLFHLLQVFCKQGPQQLEELLAQHPEMLDKYGLGREGLLQKLQLLWVASTLQRRRLFSFKQLSDFSQLSEATAEQLVVQAIGQGLVEAKVDQINKLVHVRTAIQREFGRAQWEEVLGQLEHWASAVRTLRQAKESVKHSAQPSETIPTPVSTLQ